MTQLAPLREELAMLPGPRLPDGQPTWTLHDPIRNLFFQIDWCSFEILMRWSLDDPAQIVESVSQDTTLHIDADDVDKLARFLQENQLLLPPPGAAGRFAEQLKKRQGRGAEWLLHNYLFLRIPLVRPDRWLGRWVNTLDFFFSRTFLQLTIVAGGLGVISVYRAWEQFSTTLVDMLTWQGALAYGVTIGAVKILHELGHGFTAKRFGCRVPTMGVAFLVLWPVAFTDTNEVWKLTRRDQRLKVAAAGIATELIIAVWATLAWAWLPEGWPKSVAFLLATTTWVSTIAINASPFLRFDGYFLLSDALQIPNLHARAFALARWDLRERLFALGEPVPEHFPKNRHIGLILFAYATWIYRLVLFLGIAVLVYQFFIKAVGIFLFLVEIAWFVFMPLWHEFKAWRLRWPQLRASRRARRSALAALLVTILFVLPWPTRVTTSGLLQPRQQLVIYAPPQARIAALPFANNSRVEAGSVLLTMTSNELDARAGQSAARQERLSWQSASAGFDPEQRGNWQLLNEQLASASAEGETVSADAARYSPIAPYNGTLRDVDPDMRVGDPVAHRELLGRLVADGGRRVVTYVDDDEIERIAPGDRALFMSQGLAGPNVRLTVSGIDRDASRSLGEPELASIFGGHVVVREIDGQLYPERAAYRVELVASDSDDMIPAQSWRGTVTIAGTWQAPGMRFLRHAFAVMWREVGF